MAFHEAKICCSRSLNRGHRNLTDRDSCNKGLHHSLHNLYQEKKNKVTLFKIGRSPRSFDITTYISCYFMCYIPLLQEGEFNFKVEYVKQHRPNLYQRRIICLRRITRLRQTNRLDINPVFRRILAPNSSSLNSSAKTRRIWGQILPYHRTYIQIHPRQIISVIVSGVVSSFFGEEKNTSTIDKRASSV